MRELHLREPIIMSVDSGAQERLIYIKRLCMFRDKTLFHEEWRLLIVKC